MNIHDLYDKWINTSDRTVIRFNPFTLVTPYGSSKYTIEQRLNFPYIYIYVTKQEKWSITKKMAFQFFQIQSWNTMAEAKSSFANMFVNMTLIKSQKIFAVNYAKQEITENRFLRLWRSNHEKTQFMFMYVLSFMRI